MDVKARSYERAGLKQQDDHQTSPKTLEDLEDHGQEVEWTTQLEYRRDWEIRANGQRGPMVDGWDYTTVRHGSGKERETEKGKGKEKAHRRDSVIEEDDEEPE